MDEVLVERDAERAAFAEVLDRARRGRGGVVLVEARPRWGRDGAARRRPGAGPRPRRAGGAVGRGHRGRRRRARPRRLPEHRALFDRVHRLVEGCRPGAELVLSHGMPTFVVGRRRFHVGVWKHGLSFYGWEAGAFLDRHPGLKAHKGTIRLTPDAGATVTDDELRELIGLALG